VTRIAAVPGVDGCLAAAGGLLAMKGRLPELRRMDADRSRITEVRLGTRI